MRHVLRASWLCTAVSCLGTNPAYIAPTGTTGGSSGTATATVATTTQTTEGSGTAGGGPGLAFEERCRANGILICEGFDEESVVSMGAGGGTDSPQWVESAGIGGGGAMRFEVRGMETGEQAGLWTAYFGETIGPGDTVYLQFRMKVDEVMLRDVELFTAATTIQQFTLRGEGGGCDATITGEQELGNGISRLHGSCSNDVYALWIPPYNNADHFVQWGGTYDDLEVSLPEEEDKPAGIVGDPMLLEAGVNLSSPVRCHFNDLAPGNSLPETCRPFRADQWMTFYYEIRVGEIGGRAPDIWGRIRGYIGYEGGPLEQYVDRVYVQRSTASTVEGYSRLDFDPIGSMKDEALDHPTGRVWYDELIVSREPIAAPLDE